MSYKNLENFTHIFNRQDYNGIGDLKNIKQITNIILKLKYVDLYEKDKQSLVSFLKNYLKNLRSFYNWINTKRISKIEEGVSTSITELTRTINLLNEPASNRSSVSRHSLKKFNKRFLYGLNQLLVGIRLSFQPDFVSFVNTTKNQLARYIIDGTEGLKTKFLFNRKGAHSFMNKINDMDKKELVSIENLLLKRTNIRMINGWEDFGYGGTKVRILAKPKNFGKQKVYFLYHNNNTEHPIYENQLETHHENVDFVE